MSVAQSNDGDVEIPLAVDFSFLQSFNDSFSIEDIWDGENVNSGIFKMGGFQAQKYCRHYWCDFLRL